MNILLISPEFPDTFWSFKHALKFTWRKSVSPPLGLLTVAAMLPHEWSKRLVDLNVTRLKPQDLAWADYVFISGMTVQKPSAQQVIRQCKAAGKKIVAGGPMFTLEHEAFPGVDHFVLNEAEVTLPEFLDDLARGEPKHMYTSTKMPDLRQSPVPLWELVNPRHYATMNIQFSRGCPYNCDFCNVTALFGHRPRIKTAAQIIAELDALYAMGWRDNVFFVDDNLIGNKKYLKTELLPALIEWRKDKIGITFSTEVSVNIADDDELVRMMVAAGFSNVFLGIETPNEESLAECGKKQNLRRNLITDVKRLQRAGLHVQGGFILGFDSDTPTIFQRQIEFIQRSGIVIAMVGLLQAPPGTRLYERLAQAARLRAHSSGDNVDGTTNIIPIMNLDTLLQGYKSVLRYIYAPFAYYQRVRTFLREYRLPPARVKLSWEHVLAFIKSAIHLGVVGKERIEYWKLLFWALIRRPALFPTAVTLAIYGYHFRRVCELRVK